MTEYASDHPYEDKYALIEFVTNSTIGSFANVLQLMGVEDLEKPLEWVHSKKQAVTLSFEATESNLRIGGWNRTQCVCIGNRN